MLRYVLRYIVRYIVKVTGSGLGGYCQRSL